ncbi:hypothetical protein EJ05DRAFT_352509 [Pseudovirgaria hyperparasitica]|uniref:Fatty acid hydroxylase domain-containing protein n=1 Tax=Pseudovirgaria hyperparasitica TaxID=470096 RepID=A0A6A6W9B0_9PEZI|nr:uncharacterized protein EJ05DRAFT_352509 [Pseudovirgaria hyperparasitica]KAF2758486.1 hypothetical protein EJ05DRAFT_352509 [Pseudovirgaria hyperparasitica]
MVVAQRNAKDSMKSTWRTKDKSEWNFWMWFLDIIHVHPTDVGTEPPVHKKTDKMPYVTQTSSHIWIILHALWPLVVHQLYVNYTGHNIHPAAAVALYSTAFTVNAIHQINALRRMGNAYGHLDGEVHRRDEVPDHSVRGVVQSLLSVAFLRPVMCTFLGWRSSQVPTDMTWWTPIEIGLYGVILDFWFYWYHRAMHDVSFLWKYHRTHHLTKHPNPLLTIYADTEQEIFDIIGIPLLTYATMRLLGLPMNFYDWWMCHQYVAFSEVMGHSGVRVYTTTVSVHTKILGLFGCELTVEDHDIHHRMGYRKTKNYGKQTLLWDRLFGTAGKRIECVEENVDFADRIGFSWF